MEWTKELLDEYRAYAGDDPRERREVTREAFAESPPARWSLPDFLAALDDAASRIPEERRSDAIVKLEGGYDDWTVLVITYTDLETDEEVARRIGRFLERNAEREARDRRAYECLKAKYGA